MRCKSSFKHSRGLGFSCQLAGGCSEWPRTVTEPSRSVPFTIPNSCEPFRTVQNRFEPFGTVSNRSEPSRNRSETVPKPFRNRSETVPKPFRAAQRRAPAQFALLIAHLPAQFRCRSLSKSTQNITRQSKPFSGFLYGFL